MKKYYLVAMALVVVLAISFIGYGVFVNYKGESAILERMNNRAVVVHTAKAANMEINAQYNLEEATMQAMESVDVIAKVDGVITEHQMHKNMVVHPGDTLAVLTNEDVPLRIRSAESAVKRAEAVELQTRNSYNRYLQLMEQDATSREKLDEARANYEAAQASLSDAQAQYEQNLLNQNRLRVTSDVGGSVLVIYKERGNYITAGTPICLIGNFEKMWFAEYMKDEEIRSLVGDQGENAQLTLSFKRPDFRKPYNTEYGGQNNGLNSKFNITIDGIYPSLSEPADFRRVVFYVYNPTAVLEARSYEDMVLTSSIKRTALVVPIDALRNTNTGYSVFVVNEQNELEEHRVELGAYTDDYVEVLSGITAGEIVVISGVEDLKVGQKVEIDTEDR